MYLVAILVVIVATFVLSVLSSGSVLYYINIPSLVSLLIFVLPMLFASGLAKDFNGAFKLAYKKEENTTMLQLKRAIEAVNLVMKSLLITGAFMFIFFMILVLRQLDDPASLGPKISVGLITLFYAIGFSISLLPIRSRLRKRLLEFMQ